MGTLIWNLPGIGDLDEKLLATASGVRTVADFKQWTRDCIRPILPHEALLCGLGHLHAAGVAIEYLVLVDYPAAHLEAIRNRAGAIDSPIVRRWLAKPEPLMFDAEHPWPDTPEGWLESFRRHDLRNLVAHAIADPHRSLGSYHGFCHIPERPGQRHLDLIRTLAPVMHEVLYRAIDYYGTEREPDPVLTEREREILQWVSHGKTNAEIASLVGLSETTVKHYISGVFNKLSVSNRSQLVRRLVKMESQKTPGAGTRLL